MVFARCGLSLHKLANQHRPTDSHRDATKYGLGPEVQ